MSYTLLSLLGVLGALVLDLLVLRTTLVRRRAFWTAYAIVLGFQLLVNGVLTGIPVVRYDESQIVGWRIAYAPVEDLLFGFALVTVTLATWVWLGRTQRRAVRAARAEAPAARRGRGGQFPR
ncbi:MAG TPA: lycopene cyclase domain-containing protein [Jatrophihabitantaceae bacterium]|nr:lycopene cyclase domain-containing protein [Jatrophihabitantaceae bacterium]